MTKEDVIRELTEEFRVNDGLRRRLGIEDGMEVTPITAQADDGDPVGLSWADKEGTDVALQVFTSGE